MRGLGLLLPLLVLLPSPAAAQPRPAASATNDRTGLLRGRLLDPEGKGVADARIKAMRVDFDTGIVDATVETTTDRTGAFAIPDCPTGRVLVVADHPEFSAEAAAAATVVPGPQPTEVRLDLRRGGRIVGTVRNRAGRPLADAKVAFVPASDSTSLNQRPPVATRPDGSFDLRHMPAESGTLMAVIDPGGSGQRIAAQTVEVVEGDTTTAPLEMSEVVISGRVMRSGAPGSGLRVTVTNRTLSNERRLAETVFGLQPSTGQGNSTTTDADGAFSVIASAPGPAFVQVATIDGTASFPSQDLDVPDADTCDLDLSVGGSAVSGVVTDTTTGRPLETASVCAHPAAARASTEKRRPYAAGSCMRTDAEGRFRLEVEPGGYVLRASDFERGYRQSETPVSVPDSGLDDLQLAIEKAPSLEVRAVDARGRAIAGAFVTACDEQGNCVLRGGHASEEPGTLARSDGRLLFQDLEQRPYNLFALSLPGGHVGFRAGVHPGTGQAVVTLRAGSKVTVRTLGSGGPVAGAQVVVQAIDGHAASVIRHTHTDGQGLAVLSMPPGRIDVVVRRGPLEGRGSAHVPPGGEGEVTVSMASAAASTSR